MTLVLNQLFFQGTLLLSVLLFNQLKSFNALFVMLFNHSIHFMKGTVFQLAFFSEFLPFSLNRVIELFEVFNLVLKDSNLTFLFFLKLFKFFLILINDLGS